MYSVFLWASALKPRVDSMFFVIIDLHLKLKTMERYKSPWAPHTEPKAPGKPNTKQNERKMWLLYTNKSFKSLIASNAISLTEFYIENQSELLYASSIPVY